MRNGKLVRSVTALVTIVGVFALAACSRTQLSPGQREQAEASSFPFVKTLVSAGYQAVDVSKPDGDQMGPQKVTVMFKKCAIMDTFEQCGGRTSPFAAPAVYFDADVDGDKLTVTGLKQFVYQPEIQGRKWTCRPIGAYEIEKISLKDGQNALVWAYKAYPHEGKNFIPMVLPTDEPKYVQWDCGHN